MGTRGPVLLAIVLLSQLFLTASPAASASEADRLWLVGSQAFNDQIYGLAQRMLDRFVLRYPEDPRHPAAVLLLAKSRLALGALEAALQSFRQARRLPTPPGEPGEARFWEGETLFRLKRYAEAQVAYEAVLREPSPLAADALYGLGWVGLHQNQPEAAVRAFRRLLSGWPTHPTAPAAVYHLARTLAELKRPAEVHTVLMAYETTYPDSPWLAEALYLRGWSQLTMGQFEAATATLQSFLARAPTHELAPQAQIHLAEALLRQGKQAEGRQQLGALLSAAPTTAEVLYDTGLLAQRLQHLTEAEQAWRRLQVEFAHHPLAQRASLELARAAFDQQRYADAEAAARAAAASADPQVRLEARLLAGESLLQLKRYSVALQAFKSAVDESPSDHPLRLRALAGLGLAHEHLQKWTEAIRLYQLVANSRDDVLKKWATERLKAIKAQRPLPGREKMPSQPREQPTNSEPRDQR